MISLISSDEMFLHLEDSEMIKPWGQVTQRNGLFEQVLQFESHLTHDPF